MQNNNSKERRRFIEINYKKEIYENIRLGKYYQL